MKPRNQRRCSINHGPDFLSRPVGGQATHGGVGVHVCGDTGGRMGDVIRNLVVFDKPNIFGWGVSICCFGWGLNETMLLL